MYDIRSRILPWYYRLGSWPGHCQEETGRWCKLGPPWEEYSASSPVWRTPTALCDQKHFVLVLNDCVSPTIPVIYLMNPACFIISELALYAKQGSSLARSWLVILSRVVLTWFGSGTRLVSRTSAWTAAAEMSPRAVAWLAYMRDLAGSLLRYSLANSLYN